MRKLFVLGIAMLLCIAMTGLGSAWTWGPVTTTDQGSSSDSGTTPSGATWTKATSYKSSTTVYGAGSGNTVPAWFLAMFG